MVQVNQSKEDFYKWLRSQHGTATAIAGDPCHCWLAKWFESQGVYVWGVFPESSLERCNPAPGDASQELLLDDPEEADFNKSDRISLEDWACDFAREVDYFAEPFRAVSVSRNQALTALSKV